MSRGSSATGPEADYIQLCDDLARAIAHVCPPWLNGHVDDLVQAALVKLAEVRRRYEGNPEFLPFYLRKAAYSAVVDEIRRTRRLREIALDNRDTETADEVAEPASIYQPSHVAVEALTSRLSDDERLDIAAKIASRHPGLEGQTANLRSLLAWRASWGRMAHAMAGEPRRVVTAAELHHELQARIGSEAISTIWQERVLQPREVALALGAKEGNREKVRSLRQRSHLLGLPRGRAYLYPAFQIDLRRREVYPEVREINEALGAADDPWGVASWWTSANDRLGARLMDLVGTPCRDEIVEAAKAAIAPVG